MSLIATLRADGRLPLRTIQRHLATVHGVRLRLGGLIAVLRRVAGGGDATAQQIQAQVQGSPVVHADETGWREAGRNCSIWTFSTPTKRSFVCGRRVKEMVDQALGPDFDGVLVTDFYAAYNHYAGLQQRCWAHLLRAVHELRTLSPTDARLQHWTARVQQRYREAVAFCSAVEAERLAAQRRFQRRLLADCRAFLGDPLAPQRRLCLRVQRFVTELFVFVATPEVPPDNNAAERSLRHLVTARTISGGSRSPPAPRRGWSWRRSLEPGARAARFRWWPAALSYPLKSELLRSPLFACSRTTVRCISGATVTGPGGMHSRSEHQTHEQVEAGRCRAARGDCGAAVPAASRSHAVGGGRRGPVGNEPPGSGALPSLAGGERIMVSNR